MDYHTVNLITRMEHQMLMKKMKPPMEYDNRLEIDQPSWLVRQIKRLRLAFGNVLITFGKRLSQGQRMSEEPNVMHTTGQEVAN